jgi:DNA invertase Pin-like site-specific DNA recombinase
MTPKRVGTLYRVSTKGQLNSENDIPMQRNACQEFAKRQGWIIVKEYLEGGVSGFKTSALNRDAIVEAKNDAINKNIDVLLVFMFDRLGRKEEETPFIVEWFDKNGVEVWSVKEGQRKFENHVDNLINYITFWQSSGESKKTSMRVKEAIKQMIEEGRFKGGTPPYGYDFVPSGEYNKRDKELMKLTINIDEANVVKEIFDLYVSYGYGSLRIAKALNSKNIPTKTQGEWIRQTISKIISNPIYIGKYRLEHTIQEIYNDYGKEYKSVKLDKPIYSKTPDEAIRIIDDETFHKAQELMKNKTNKKTSLPTKSPLLYSGLLYCGHCGSKMLTKNHMVYWTNKDGTKKSYKKYKYICGKRKENKCTGKYSYSSEVTDSLINTQVGLYMNDFQIFTKSIDTTQLEYDKKNYEKLIKQFKDQQKEIKQNIKLFENEITKSLQGNSSYDATTLSRILKGHEENLNQLESNIEKSQKSIKDIDIKVMNMQKQDTVIKSYLEEFYYADIQKKKIILSKFFNRIFINDKGEVILECFDIIT